MMNEEQVINPQTGYVCKRRRKTLEEIVYSLLSEKWCGNDIAPLDHHTLYVNNNGCEYVFSFLNDSFEVGLGYPSKWHTIIRRECFHKIMFWYLRQWIFSEWFGLRRKIWYWLLHRRCTKRNNLIKG
jgi:hypothetical protein